MDESVGLLGVSCYCEVSCKNSKLIHLSHCILLELTTKEKYTIEEEKEIYHYAE